MKHVRKRPALGKKGGHGAFVFVAGGWAAEVRPSLFVMKRIRNSANRATATGVMAPSTADGSEHKFILSYIVAGSMAFSGSRLLTSAFDASRSGNPAQDVLAMAS